MAKSNTKAYDVIADRILDLLDKGEVPWRKPWSLQPGMSPHNATSKRPYSGINALMLGLAGYYDPRWITYRRAADLGGNVRRGAKGMPVVFWKASEREVETPDTGEIETKTWWMLRYYTVFNVEQTEGLGLPMLEQPEEFDAVEAAEAIITNMPNKPAMSHDGGNPAYYRPSTDSIHLPPRHAFSNSEEYYSTALHELGHATGHESRLNRHGMETGIAPFGSPTYSREELVAEFTAAFLCNESGITNTVDNSAAYIQGWAKAINKDRRLVVQAASQGQKAADYILARSAGHQTAG